MTLITPFKTNIVTPFKSSLLGVPSTGGSAPVLVDPMPDYASIYSILDFSDESSYTYSSGVLVSKVASGASGTDYVSSGFPEYSSTAMGGQGGLKFTTRNQFMRGEFSFSVVGNGYPQTVILACYMPPFATFGDFLSYASGTNVGNTNGRLIMISDTQLEYRSTASGSPDLLTSGVSDNIHIFALRYKNSTQLDLYANSTTPVFINENHQNTIGTLNQIRLGDRSIGTGIENLELGYFFHSSESLTDEQMTESITYLASKFGVSI